MTVFTIWVWELTWRPLECEPGVRTTTSHVSLNYNECVLWWWHTTPIISFKHANQPARSIIIGCTSPVTLHRVLWSRIYGGLRIFKQLVRRTPWFLLNILIFDGDMDNINAVRASFCLSLLAYVFVMHSTQRLLQIYGLQQTWVVMLSVLKFNVPRICIFKFWILQMHQNTVHE